jgi:hypothetical protein
MLKGTVNLANIKNMIPLEKGTDLNGIESRYGDEGSLFRQQQSDIRTSMQQERWE